MKGLLLCVIQRGHDCAQTKLMRPMYGERHNQWSSARPHSRGQLPLLDPLLPTHREAHRAHIPT